MERNPSHLGSNDRATLGICGTDLASIGATGGITGSCMLAILAYRLLSISSDCQCRMGGWWM